MRKKLRYLLNRSSVVALSEPTLDAVLALGVKPVGTISGRGQQTVPNYLKDKVGDDVTLVGSVSEVNYDKVPPSRPTLFWLIPQAWINVQRHTRLCRILLPWCTPDTLAVIGPSTLSG